MKHILLLGAGLSTTSLINYLLKHAESENWFVRIGDDVVNRVAEFNREQPNIGLGRRLQNDPVDKQVYLENLPI